VVGGAVAPCLPFAVEAVRIHAPCAARMVAWVRFADGASAPAGGAPVKVDIDLCDEQGATCATLRGFSSRPLRAAAFDEGHYQAIVAALLNNEISVEHAVELGNKA
jgi:hypothetical protein